MRPRLQAFLDTKYFQRGIMAVIILNTVVLGLEVIRSVADRCQTLLTVLNVIFTVIYVVEAVIKIYAWRGGYFKDGWNLFDFVIVVTCLIPTGGVFGSLRIMRLLRVLRVLRALRLISGVRQLRKIVMTVISALPGVGWAGALMLLLYYIFTIIGIHLFRDSHPDLYGDFGTAFVTLFELTTLEGWQDIVKPVTAEHPAAWIYFLIFIVFASFILLNLVVGIVVDSIDEMNRQEAADDIQEAKDEGRDLAVEFAALEAQLLKVKYLLEAENPDYTTLPDRPPTAPGVIRDN
jgi:voltage-gated sodium channel